MVPSKNGYSWRRMGAGVKLTLAVGAATLVIISVFAYVNIRSHNRSLLAEVERHATQLSEAVRLGTEYDMLLNHREMLHETIRRMGDQPSIQRIRVLNKAGNIIYSSDVKEIGGMVDRTAESCYKCHTAGRPLERLDTKERTRVFRPAPGQPRVLGIITPIYNAPACWTAACHAHPRSRTVLGVLDVTMPLAEADRDIRRAGLEIGVFAFSAIAALGLILTFAVRRLVGRPVAEMLEATRRVAGGDLTHTIPVHSEDELGMLAKSFNNMTQKLSEARLQLFQSDKLASLGRLAAGVAHEINNPLTGVLTYSSLMLKNAKDHPELKEDLEVIVRETIRSREIVKSLLDFARQSVPKKARADVNAIVGRAAAVVENQMTLNRVRLEKRLDPALPQATVDANQLQQVFINLFVNAVDAIGPKGGTITVSSSALSLPPAGNALVRAAVCPKRHSLVDREARIDGKPALRLKVRSGEKEGVVYLNPVYRAAGHRATVPLDGPGAQFACPECSAQLSSGKVCPKCGGALYLFEAPPHGMLEGCARKDCGWQRWEDVDAAGDRAYIELRVRDTGCGIPPENLQKIFEPFYSTKEQKGTGLGLAVTWGIVDNHNGTIAVESEPGAGTVFTIRLPVTI